MLRYLFIVLAAFSPLNAASISEKTAYPDFCSLAAEDEELFASFKRHPSYTIALEHVSGKEGKLYLDYIRKKYPELLQNIRWRENDAIGQPITYDYGDEVGAVSPTTLRYLKVAGDLQRLFGDLSQLHIVEIGGGYGGQCKVLDVLGGFASYTIIDLPPCCALTKKYLERQGVSNVSFLSNEELSQVGNYDLIISNYAFSEIDWIEQQGYLDAVIDPTPRGYLTCNFISHLFGLRSISLAEFVAFLREGDKAVSVVREEPQTNPYNVLVTWK